MDEQDVFDEDTEESTDQEVEAEETEESEKGEAKSEAETEDEEEESPSSDTKTVPMSALIAERRKRQEAEERLSKAEKVPDPVTDPEGYEEYQDSKFLTDRIKLTQDLARDTYEDYGEKEKVFMDLVSTQGEDGSIQITDESLYRKFVNSPNPAKFAYNHAKNHLDYLEKSSEDYEKSVEQRVIERLKKQGLLSVDAADLPDLTNAADVESNNSLTEKGDADRIDVFDD